VKKSISTLQGAFPQGIWFSRLRAEPCFRAQAAGERNEGIKPKRTGRTLKRHKRSTFGAPGPKRTGLFAQRTGKPVETGWKTGWSIFATLCHCPLDQVSKFVFTRGLKAPIVNRAFNPRRFIEPLWGSFTLQFIETE
jgi:hypothetical protein